MSLNVLIMLHSPRSTVSGVYVKNSYRSGHTHAALRQNKMKGRQGTINRGLDGRPCKRFTYLSINEGVHSVRCWSSSVLVVMMMMMMMMSPAGRLCT